MEDRLLKQDGTDLEINFGDFQDFAFDSHVDAYWNLDGTVPFYELEVQDLVNIFQTIDFKDIVSRRGVKQEIKLGEKYIKHYGEKTQKNILDFIQTLQKNINSLVSNEE